MEKLPWIDTRLVVAGGVTEAADAAHGVLACKQKPPPDLGALLGTAVAVWETRDENKARSFLETAVELAGKLGFL